MQPYALIDLHCDTLTALTPEDTPLLTSLRNPSHRRDALSALAKRIHETNTLDLPGRHFSLSAIPDVIRWCQCCAIFIPDGLSQAEAAAYYETHLNSFYRQMSALSDKVSSCRTSQDIETAWAQSKTAAILTVENGSVLAGRLDRVETLARDGVKMITLTWNGENEIGSGNVTDHGLSSFGKQAVRELERHNILVDVSHLNDQGFRDVLDTAQKPFAASHSNARSVCGHQRNLTDGQIREMTARKCLIGLNYTQDFLRTGDRPANLNDLWRHVEHFLELGAERCLALGSDADGTDVPPGLDCPVRFAGLYQFFLDRGLSVSQAEGILWRNALDFFNRAC